MPSSGDPRSESTGAVSMSGPKSAVSLCRGADPSSSVLIRCLNNLVSRRTRSCGWPKGSTGRRWRAAWAPPAKPSGSGANTGLRVKATRYGCAYKTRRAVSRRPATFQCRTMVPDPSPWTVRRAEASERPISHWLRELAAKAIQIPCSKRVSAYRPQTKERSRSARSLS
jgi:hypothetical protein